MNLNLEDWEEADIFNLLQILLTAKFDSGRSSEMMGSPLINSLLRQVLDHEFKGALYVRLVANITASPIGNAAIACMASVLVQTMPDWTDDELENYITTMAYPFIVSDQKISLLKGEARSK